MNRHAWPAVLACVTVASGAFANDSASEKKRACIASHANAQRARLRGEILHARSALKSCAAPECPELIRSECNGWLEGLQTPAPSVVFAAKDARGNAMTRVRVQSGDRVLTPALTGTATVVEPGLHELEFRSADGRIQRIRLTISPSAQEQLVEVTFADPPEASPLATRRLPAEPQHGLPRESWVLGGVSVGALISASYFGLTGLSLQRDLEQRCAPRCAQADVDSMQRRYLVADISLGLSLVAAAGAIWLALDPPAETRKTTSHVR